jgi:hypothetical protein
MFMLRRQMGGQVDSKRERAGDSWERDSVIASLHMHSCAHIFMFFFMQANGWAGEQQKGRCACNRSWLHTFRRAYCFMRANGWAGEQGKGRRACNFCEWGGVLESTHIHKSV